MNILDIIPTGSDNSITRINLLNLCKLYGLANTDREMRKLIENARSQNVIICLSNGRGYFRPTKDDLPELRHYVEQERDRSLTILNNLKMANNLLEDMESGRI